MGVGSETTGRASRNRIGACPASPVRTRLLRQLGEGSFSSPGWRGWSVKPKGRVTGGMDFVRMDDERVVRDYKPEPIAREV